jgi:hypothetical protein
VGRRLALAAVALAALCLLAGCNALLSDRADPATDRLGWENGYWAEDSLSVTTEDGLNESEREAVVSRTMARVERIRGLEFEESVPVSVITRAQYRANNSDSDDGGAYGEWNNQVWEALFLVGENRDVSAAFDSTLGSTVQGYYSPSKGAIVIVSDAETPTIDRATLAHELVHALQDQHYGLGGSPDFQDTQLAHRGVTEGDANYVQQLYERRCGEQWSCLPRPERSTGGRTNDFDVGVFVTIYTPYAVGPRFVAERHQREGWGAVNDLYDRYPNSTEQIIHPEKYPDEEPLDVRVRDRSNGRWNRFGLQRPAYDVVGEASIYAMFRATDRITDGAVYEYDHRISAGWGGDKLVPYRNGDRYGYVWATEWDTREDAREFVTAHRAILDERASRQPDADTYVLPDSDPFGDAFRVTRSGKRVVIVNGPTVDSLDGIHG